MLNICKLDLLKTAIFGVFGKNNELKALWLFAGDFLSAITMFKKKL
jgi:hypothetical protein